ncbi:MAG: TonB-dependent receptor [Sideroxydans sp.]|nr:TonB-dependent receptor [Sideroxydans sp.]
MKKKYVAMSALPLVLSAQFMEPAYAEDAPVAASASLPAEVAPTTTAAPTVAATQPKSHTMLGDVVVSASKIAQSSVEAPANVTVFTAKKLESTNNPRIGDALVAKVPGLYMRGGAVASGRPGSTSTSSMRGLNGGVAVLVDGMNMVDAYSGGINWSTISMDNVDNIEVVPGVGSTLYGTGAMGGVINITTKAPTKKEITLKQGISVGDGAGQYGNAQYRNKFENGLGVSFGLGQIMRDGFVNDYITKTPSGVPAGTAKVVTGMIETVNTKGVKTYIVGDRGKYAYKQQNVNGKLYYDLSPTSKVHVGVDYTVNKSTGNDGSSYLIDTATGNPLPLSNVAATSLNMNGLATTIKEQDFYSGIPHGNNALRTFAGYEGNVLDNSKLNVNVGSIKRDSWSTTSAANASMKTGPGTLSTSPNSTTNATAQLSQPFGDSQFIVAGMASEWGNLNQKRYTIANWNDENSARKVINQVDAKSNNISLFVQDQIAVNDTLILYVGGRYDNWRASGTAFTPAVAASAAVAATTTNPAIAAVTAASEKTTVFSERKASAFSPKLSAVYKFNDGFSVKTSVGTAFNAPSNYDLFANSAWTGGNTVGSIAMSASSPDLKPEKAQTFDVSTEYVFNEGGTLKAAYYITKTNDLVYSVQRKVTQFLDPVSNKLIDYISGKENMGSGLARGVELSGEYPVLSWLTASASYAFSDSKITSMNSTDPVLLAVVGKRMINVPKDTARFALEANQGDWSGMVSTRYVGEQFSSADNSDVVKGVFAGYSKYAVSDLKVSYRLTHDLKASLMVDNLADRQYYEYYRQAGRSTTVELAGHF